MDVTIMGSLTTQEGVFSVEDIEIACVHLLEQEVLIEKEAPEANVMTANEAQVKLETFDKKISEANQSLRLSNHDLELAASEPMDGENGDVETKKTEELAVAISAVEGVIESFRVEIEDSMSEVRGKDEKGVDVEKYVKVAEVLIDLGFTPEEVGKVSINLGD